MASPLLLRREGDLDHHPGDVASALIHHCCASLAARVSCRLPGLASPGGVHPMTEVAPSTKRLTRFYGEISSLAAMMQALAAEGVDTAHLRPNDVYTRD